MRPFIGIKSKGMWSNFWKDKTPLKTRRVFKKSARRKLKKDIETNQS